LIESYSKEVQNAREISKQMIENEYSNISSILELMDKYFV